MTKGSPVKEFFMNFQPVDNCPGCDGDAKELWGQLATDDYKFGSLTIPYKKTIGPITVYKCSACGLYFKNRVPTQESLVELFKSSFNEVWDYQYNYAREIDLVKKLYPEYPPDILDVGAGNGDFLACLNSGDRRLSALDVIRSSKCQETVTGEYIYGFLDHDYLHWSESPYDLVTVFDVMEHLYSVKQGFKNLRNLTRIGGYCLIETGDADSRFPRLYGINNWWYINLLEHHVAFGLDTLLQISSLYGFEVYQMRRKRHKYKQNLYLGEILKCGIKSMVFQIHRGFYEFLMQKLSKSKMQPCPIVSPDHLLLVLRRVR